MNFQFQDNPEATISVPADDLVVNNPSEIIIVIPPHSGIRYRCLSPSGIVVFHRSVRDPLTER